MLKVLIKYFMYLLSESLLTPGHVTLCTPLYTILYTTTPYSMYVHRHSGLQRCTPLAVPKINNIKTIGHEPLATMLIQESNSPKHEVSQLHQV